MGTPPRYLPQRFYEANLPHRHGPAEHSGNCHAWMQDERKAPKVKPSYAFIWPKDGKRGSTLGRMRDILAGKGPDIHLSISADQRGHMLHRQRRPRWSNWTDLDDRGLDAAISSHKHAPWTHMAVLGGRRSGMKYDFRTRRYGVPDRYTWTDVVWQPHADRYMYPEAIRTIRGQWYEDTSWLPPPPGGPPGLGTRR